MRIKLKPEPYCPYCGGRMSLKRPRLDQSWDPFWGCVNWISDGCMGSRDIAPDGSPEGDTPFQRPTFGKGEATR